MTPSALGADATPDPQHRQAVVVDDDVGPPQRAQLVAASAGGHRQPDQRRPGKIPLGGRSDDPSRVTSGGRLWIGLWRAAGFGIGHRVDTDPLPAHGAPEGTAEQPVHLTNAGATQWLTFVRPALLATGVFLFGAVLDEWASAVRPAATQFSVERIENVGV
jgi:hypothetical protein